MEKCASTPNSMATEFDSLSRVDCTKNTWKLGAPARQEIPIKINSKRLFVSKAKDWDRIDFILSG